MTTPSPMVFTFDYAAFIAAFPQFATSPPEAVLQMYWNQATCYVDALNYGWLNGDCRLLAINLMTAHLAAMALEINAGQTPGLVQSATVDKVTVAFVTPPINNEWQYMLNQTGYGQQLLSLLQVNSAGGFYVQGGPPERSAVRQAFGVFYPLGFEP